MFSHIFSDLPPLLSPLPKAESARCVFQIAFTEFAF